MTFDSGKLIRDKVPAILQEQGKSACCDVLDEATYEKLLNERFIEDVIRYARGSDARHPGPQKNSDRSLSEGAA
jgi:predicted house-cleaning noncanonical NTP pyrophosphatase (MazG superfamily)